MEKLFREDNVILIILWVLWCVLHSIMISVSVTTYLKAGIGKIYRYYRLFFNIISMLTIMPVLFYSYQLKSEYVFQWNGVYILFQIIIVIISIYLFYAGGKHYDFMQFLGFRQIKSKNSHSILSQSGELDNKGIMCVTRHPWYLAAILIIWARDLSYKTILVNVVLSAYLIIGTILEERKLILKFGDQYRNYQKKVSMLFPLKWLFKLFKL